MTMQRFDYHQIIRNHLSSAYLLPEEKIDSLLPRYLESLQALMHKLEHIAETETLEELSRAGHALKGALLSLGLMNLAEKAFAIEQKCKFSSVGSDCAHFIAELKEEITKII